MPQNPLYLSNQIVGGTAFAPGLLGKQRDQWISSRHGRNYNMSQQGAMFGAANSAGVTTSAALATTYVGICLSNPAGSNKNLAVMNISGAMIVAPSTITTYGIILGYAAGGIIVHTTPLTVNNSFVGGTANSAAVGLVDSACTLVGTPAWGGPLAQCSDATHASFFNVDIGGGIILAPGAYMAVGSNIAGPASGFMGGFVWEELPI